MQGIPIDTLRWHTPTDTFFYAVSRKDTKHKGKRYTIKQNIRKRNGIWRRQHETSTKPLGNRTLQRTSKGYTSTHTALIPHRHFLGIPIHNFCTKHQGKRYTNKYGVFVFLYPDCKTSGNAMENHFPAPCCNGPYRGIPLTTKNPLVYHTFFDNRLYQTIASFWSVMGGVFRHLGEVFRTWGEVFRMHSWVEVF